MCEGKMSNSLKSRVLLSLLTFVMIVFALPSAKAAEQPGIACVQAQLQASGFDAGKVDGQLGAKTRAALSQFEEAFGTVSTREIDASLGDAICRLIGLIEPRLREFWPATLRRTNVVFSESVDTSFRESFLGTVNRVVDAERTILSVELSGTDVIVVAENEMDLMDLVSRHSRFDSPDRRRRVADVCSSTRGISAFTTPGLIAVCKSPDERVGAGIDEEWLLFMLAHEFIHAVQFQLAGAVNVASGQKTVLEYEGPVWLSEGVAQAFANRVAVETPDWDFRIVTYERLEGIFPDLSELELQESLANRRSDVYRAGTVAAIDLIDLKGYSAIVAFYEGLGKGYGWHDAFERSTEMTVEEFYTYYATVKRFGADGTPLIGPLPQ